MGEQTTCRRRLITRPPRQIGGWAGGWAGDLSGRLGVDQASCRGRCYAAGCGSGFGYRPVHGTPSTKPGAIQASFSASMNTTHSKDLVKAIARVPFGTVDGASNGQSAQVSFVCPCYQFSAAA